LQISSDTMRYFNLIEFFHCLFALLRITEKILFWISWFCGHGVLGKLNFHLLFKLHLCPQYTISHFTNFVSPRYLLPLQQNTSFHFNFHFHRPNRSSFLWHREQRLWPRAIKRSTFAATMYPHLRIFLFALFAILQ